ncbi:response regulator transcription factor [Hyphomicrobium sp. CS1BSMeth3]|uniref:response regulator n=1 Tax=Hyphomicrobium sp. CS1BSMeth3 TaxID=1892844 RepID=UPI000930453C|nr:response regulator transcription factor [Hyphomicrobium sp. CS1BSMeth3]
MNTVPHVLVVDDDRELRDLVSRFLKKNGFRVDVADSGREMLRLLELGKFDLVILDRVMPGEDGLQLCRQLRAVSRIPVMMLTLLNSDTDRILGLEMGADDYLGKPFNPHELVARVRSILRRVNDLPHRSAQPAEVFRFNGWRLDRARRRLEAPGGVMVKLTDREFDLLLAFVERPRVVLTREQLSDLVASREPMPFDRSIDMQLVRLRKKIESRPDMPDMIKTVRNRGYIFTPEVMGDAK